MATRTASPPAQERPRRLGPTERRLALALLFVAPALFAGNMLTARATHELIPPVALAFWRWAAMLVQLLPFTAGALLRYRREIARGENSKGGACSSSRTRR